MFSFSLTIPVPCAKPSYNNGWSSVYLSWIPVIRRSKCIYLTQYLLKKKKKKKKMRHFNICIIKSELQADVHVSKICWIDVKRQKKVREKPRECHNHKPQPFPGTKRKRKQTKPNKRKSNKRTKSAKISSLFPKRGTRNAKRTEKHKNKITQAKIWNKSPRKINHKATLIRWCNVCSSRSTLFVQACLFQYLG